MKTPRLPKRKSRSEAPSRITNETVAEHRERILAGGRRYKYPMQYARHRLVINASILGVVAIILAAVIVWQQLYVAQSTNDFLYRITRAVPVPVASVDGKAVQYSDYLLTLKPSLLYLQRSEQVNFESKDGRQQLLHAKRKSLDSAEVDAYAAKLAKELKLSVSDEEVTELSNQTRASFDNASQEVYNASALSVLGWSTGEYRSALRHKLLHLKVAYRVDEAADRLQQEAGKALASDPATDLSALAKQLNPSGRQVSVGASGIVPINNYDYGLSAAASKLNPGEVSKVVKTTTGDGYYFVKLISKNDSQLSYAYIKIALTAFDEQFTKLRDQGKIKEYISIPKTQ